MYEADNTVVLNHDIFEQMMASGQFTPLRAYCLHFVKSADAAPMLNHPGEVTAQVKEFLELTPAQWRYFCKAAGTIPAEYLLLRGRTRMTMAAQALVDANRPSAPLEQLNDVWKRQWDHEAFSTAKWQHGDAFAAWTHLLNQFLAPSDPPHSRQDLDEVTDALRHHVQNQMPWGPGPWEVLLARSERWHWENFGQHPGRGRSALSKEGQAARWDSLLDTTTIDGFTFTPVTTGPKLAVTGAKMGNCLGNHWSRCNKGISRIFTVSTNQRRPQAAAELLHNGAAWTKGQVQGSHSNEVTKAMTRAVSKLARAYQDEETKRKRPAEKQNSHAPIPKTQRR